MALTHESGDILTDDDLAQRREDFAVFEGYLASFSRPFFDVAEEIDAILEDANS